MKNHYWLFTFEREDGVRQEAYCWSEEKRVSKNRIQLIKREKIKQNCVVIFAIYLGEFTDDEWNKEWTWDE